MDYPFESIHINSRDVAIADIVGATATADSDFEAATFGFIARWLQGNEEFNLQTSGSTGEPKKISISRFQMESSAWATRRALQLPEGGLALVCLDTRYIAGQMMLVRCLTGKMRILAIEPSANPLQTIRDHTVVDFTALVPYQLQKILESGQREKLNSIRTVIVGGAAVSSEIIHQLQPLASRFFLTYGMTETVSHIALQALNGPRREDAFHTMPGVTIDTDQRGCLVINAPYLGYPVITNDLALKVNETSFRWLGRVDHVINTGGVKVSPEKIEAILDSVKLRLNLHERIVISSVPDIALGEQIVLVIEREHIDKGLKERLFHCFTEMLPKFERPRAIVPVFPFPETATGKIDRNTLRKMMNLRP